MGIMQNEIFSKNRNSSINNNNRLLVPSSERNSASVRFSEVTQPSPKSSVEDDFEIEKRRSKVKNLVDNYKDKQRETQRLNKSRLFHRQQTLNVINNRKSISIDVDNDELSISQTDNESMSEEFMGHQKVSLRAQSIENQFKILKE